MLTIVCGCGREQTVPPALAGLTLLCKQCRGPIPVPSADGVVAPEPRPVSRFTISLPPPPPPPVRPVADVPADPAPVVEWATRGQRLLARVLDLAAAFAFAFVAVYVILPLVPGNGLVVVALSVIAFAALQVALLATRGQHVGKWVLGLVIVRDDGTRAGFVHAFLLRDGINILIGVLPGIGTVYKLLDDCFIFSADQKCLHDRIAGTRVVRLP
ncbi:MAG: RDD family protein [Planctomycetes bacterium]|nr:RDD family protein [Planctomycetota bacterium]